MFTLQLLQVDIVINLIEVQVHVMCTNDECNPAIQHKNEHENDFKLNPLRRD